MKNIHLTIPDMQSLEDKQRVQRLLDSIEGVSLNRVEMGSVDITLLDEGHLPMLLMTLNQAGYSTVHTEQNL